MLGGAGAAKANVFFGRNHLGQVRCKLCQTVHRDEANFLQHVDSGKHTENLQRLERARQRADEEQMERDQMRDLQTQSEKQRSMRDRIDALGGLSDSALNSALNSGGPGGAAAPQRRTVGRPQWAFRKEPLPETRQCRVWIDVDYPLADEASRPLHRWMSSREQTTEPIDDGVKYLVFACEPYETVAVKFPSVPHTDKDSLRHGDKDAYSASWDPTTRRYRIFFIMG